MTRSRSLDHRQCLTARTLVDDRALDLLVSVYELYDIGHPLARERHLAAFAEYTAPGRLTAALRSAAAQVHAQVLSESAHTFAPYGTSGLLLADQQSAVTMQSATLHLDQSHACAHSYPDWQAKSRGWSRVDFSLATCGPISPLMAVEVLLAGPWHVATIDLHWRGPLREPEPWSALQVSGFPPRPWVLCAQKTLDRAQRWILRHEARLPFEAAALHRQADALLAVI